MSGETFKNKADLQFAIMRAAEKATEEVRKTMEKHLAVSDELWRLTNDAIKAGLGVCLPSMRWVTYPAIVITAETDEDEVIGQRVIEEWAVAAGGAIETSVRESKSAVFDARMPDKGRIVVTLTREILE
ncbi:hypothetical protein [Neisseria sp. S1]|uniref:hypothetical protein n=1 Tax=Neisseria sp. S1 TaxID=3318354 RepID=UPI003A85384E